MSIRYIYVHIRTFICTYHNMKQLIIKESIEGMMELNGSKKREGEVSEYT